MNRIHFNRFVVLFHLTSQKTGRYAAFVSESKRLGVPYSFGCNWFLLKAPRPIDEVTQALMATIDATDRVLVLELEHGQRPTQRRFTGLLNTSELDFLNGF